MTLAGIPSGYYVTKIDYGGSNVLTQPLRVSAAPSGEILVVLRNGTAQVNGTLFDSRSQPVAGVQVALIPQQRTRSDLFRTAATDQSVRFTFPNLPPGEYKVFSWEANEPNAFFNPDFLRQYEEQGSLVRVGELANETVSLRLIPLQ